MNSFGFGFPPFPESSTFQNPPTFGNGIGSPSFQNSPSFGNANLSQPTTFQNSPTFGNGNNSHTANFGNVSVSAQNSGRVRPGDSDPLGVLTWYLESGSNANCSIVTPLAQFEIHQYNFIPFKSSSVEFPIVSLSMIQCVQRSASQPNQSAYDADYELRATIVRHVLKEMIRLRKWNALMIYRLNSELAPNMDMIYQHAIPQELNKLQPQIRPVTTQPKDKSIQIIIQSTNPPNR